MTFKQLKEISAPHFYCFSLDKFFPKTLRNVLRKAAALAALVSFAFSFDSLPLYLGLADGLFFLFIFIYLTLSFLEFFYRSMINEGLQTRINEKLLGGEKNIDYALSSILFATSEIDVTLAFFETRVGIETLLRSGLDLAELKNFVYSERTPIVASSLNLPNDFVDLPSFASLVYEADKSLRAFLTKNSINKDGFWSRENLGAIPSIGTSWSYGVSADLGKYGVSFDRLSNVSSLLIENGYRNREVTALENVLLRREEANVIIIDDSEDVVRDIVGRFLKKIRLGISLPAFEHKNIIELDWTSLTTSYKNKSELEAEILKILNQSISAGNIILYIRDLSGFVSSVKSLGVNLPSLIYPYLSSKNLSVIASATNADFHFFIETTPSLLEKFERIVPDALGAEASVAVLLEQIPSIEKQYGLIFSFPSILSLTKTADRFISYGEMPGKALDMLIEITPWAIERNIEVLKENDVSVFVSEKTGIVTGDIKEKEAGKIEHLEELLLLIVDEGHFTDAFGGTVGCRNLIITATSNAGSSFICERLKQGKNLIQE